MASDSSDGWVEIKALIIGRASPEPSKKHIETVCTGGITERGQLLRLYPIPYRYLEENQQYKLWTWASFAVQKNPQDKRKESYRVREESIRILSEVSDKSEQFSLLQKAISPHREYLDEMYKRDWTSMGVVEIELLALEARPQSRNWERDKPHVKQFHLYTEVRPLKQQPIEMRLRYRCKNNPDCKTHESTLLGWEYMAAFRKFRMQYKTGVRAFEEISRIILDRFADPSKRGYALVGTHHRYGSWMVAQLYWFDKHPTPRLF